MSGGIEFEDPGRSGHGRSVHLPCGHDAVMPPDASVMTLPTAVLEHLDRCLRRDDGYEAVGALGPVP